MTTIPQDRKTSKTVQAAKKQERFEDIEGHELLVPFKDVKGSDQARLTGRLIALGLLAQGEEAAETKSMSDINFDAAGDLIDFVEERFARDPEAFADFTRGLGGMERGLTLATAFAGEMGKDED